MDLTQLLNDFGLPIGAVVILILVVRTLWKYYNKKLEKAEAKYDALDKEYREKVEQLYKEKETIAKEFVSVMDNTVRTLKKLGGNGGD